MSTTIRLATRSSPLAVVQAKRVQELLLEDSPDLDIELVLVESHGDRNQTQPLREIGGQGVFTKEIQRAVLEGKADIAVHSAKDLPSETPEGLALLCVPERRDPADVLVGKSLEGLGPGATVATGSPRRQELLRSMRPDLNLVELRGNMATRLAMPGRDGVDAIVTAAAALERLGQEALITERLDPLMFVPQVGQGALALEGRAGDPVAEVLQAIDLVDDHRCLDAERSFLATLGAGCSVPVGAWCVVDGEELEIRSVMFLEETHSIERRVHRGTDPAVHGRTAAHSYPGFEES